MYHTFFQSVGDMSDQPDAVVQETIEALSYQLHQEHPSPRYLIPEHTKRTQRKIGRKKGAFAFAFVYLSQHPTLANQKPMEKKSMRRANLRPCKPRFALHYQPKKE
jgi:hypothetical protein